MLKNYQSLNWRTFRTKVYQFGVFVALILGVANQSNAQTYLSEGFESGIPAAWTQEQVSGTENWIQDTQNDDGSVSARTGNNLALFVTTNYGDATKLVTPSMDLSGATNPTLTFYYTNVGFWGDIDELRVYYKTSAGGTWTQIGVDYTAEMTSWKEVILSLPNPSADYYIAFEGYSNWANGVTLDDITVENITCPKPTNLSAITMLNSANLSWIAGAGETSWNIEWGVSGFTQGTGTVINGVTTNPYTLNGLSAATSYQYYIQADCGGGDLSSWAGPFTFTTPCVATNIPYLEDFELATIPNMPSCTSIENAGTGNNWTTDNGNSSLLSTNVLYYEYNSTDAANAWFYTRGLNLTAGTSYRLKFDYTNEDDFYMEKMRVAIGQSAANASMTTQLLDFPSISTLNLEQGLIDFTVPTSGVYYIGFNAYSDVNEFNLYVDNISVDLSPSCTEPTAVTISNVATTTADVSWTAPVVAPADGYAYYVNTTNTIPATATGTVAAGVTTANLTGLTDATTYYVWVKSVCGAGDTSMATSLVTFTTPCVATNIPYLEDFELATIPNMPSCTSIENAGTGNNWTTDNTNSTLLPTTVLRYKWNSTSAANAWFYTRGLNLTAGTSYRLKFDYTNEDDYYIEKMRVAIGQSAANASMTTQLLDFPSISTLNLEQGLIDFTVPTSGVYYIGFNAYSDVDEYNLYVDNISVDLSPSCVEPHSLTTNATSSTTGSVKWNQSLSNPANGYQYYVSTSNTAPTNTTTPTGTTVSGDTTVNLTGLTADMTYYVWVRSMCSSSDTSAWTNVSSFYTGYCIPVSDYTDTYIDSVYTVGGIVNIQKNATGYENTGYANNFSTDSLVIMKGDTVTMHFYLEAPYDAGVALYIDTNNNMIFDANEMISSSNSYIASGSYSFQYSVPATMQPGTYRARLIADYGLDNPLACSFTDFFGSEGEAEDYKIVVVPACTPPTVDLGADTTICAGNSVTLDAGNTGLSYVWSNNAVSQTITVNAAGKYFVTVKDGVCSTMDSIQVTITPNPTVSIQASKLIACPNDTIVLTANGASTYLWNDNSTDTVRTVYPTQTTTYSVTGKNGNCSASASVSIAIKTTGCETGLEDMDLTNVSVYPNPASSTVRIVGEELTQYYQSMTVVDLTGRTVIEMPIRSNEESIHVSNLVNGIYFVNLQGKQTKTVKIEVKH